MVVGRHELAFSAFLLVAVGALVGWAGRAIVDEPAPVVVGCRCPDLSGGE